MFGLGVPEMFVLSFIGIFFILPFWKIFSKAGYPGWLSLLMVVPLLNLGMLFYLAFSEWPIQQELKHIKGSV